jgi:hypothetical protein
MVPERLADSWQLVAVGPIEGGARVAMVSASSVRVVGCLRVVRWIRSAKNIQWRVESYPVGCS